MKIILEKLNNDQVNCENMINDLIKYFLKKMLKSEITEFLNRAKYEITGKKSGNSCNGNYSCNFQNNYGVIENLEVPRYRNNDF